MKIVEKLIPLAAHQALVGVSFVGIVALQSAHRVVAWPVELVHEELLQEKTDRNNATAASSSKGLSQEPGDVVRTADGSHDESADRDAATETDRPTAAGEEKEVEQRRDAAVDVDLPSHAAGPAEPAQTDREQIARRAIAHARQLALAFRFAAEKAMPSVVKILTRARGEEEQSFLDIVGGSDEQLFDMVGSGVIVSPDGIVLTNHHVIEGAVRIEVRLPDGREFGVRETKSDPRSDLAIIRLDTEEELPVAELGASKDLHVGDLVLAIGSPFTLESSVSAGIISGTGRYRQLSTTVSGQFIQTDAAINPGNSGGPLLDLEGRVIGINTAISTRSGAFQGIGFAIPIDRAKWIMRELLEHGKVRRAIIGVGTARVPYEVARQIGLPRSTGALVVRLMAGYPGESAGIKRGDIIVEFDGQRIDGPAEFAELVQQSPIGKPIPVVVLRNGERVELQVELISRE